jgi:hypothetical protein
VPDAPAPGPLGSTALVDQPTQPHSVLGDSQPAEVQQDLPEQSPIATPLASIQSTPAPAIPAAARSAATLLEPQASPAARRAPEGIASLGSESYRAASLRATNTATRRSREASNRHSTVRPKRAPRWLKWAIAIAGVVTVTTLAATILFSGSDKPATTPAAKVKQGAVKPVPSETEHKKITVAVLNGTAITGLASTTSEKLSKAGFTPGSTGNSADQQQVASLVLYAPNKRQQALEVARQLNISSVQQADIPTQTRAGSNADVIVVVGSDQTP